MSILRNAHVALSNLGVKGHECVCGGGGGGGFLRSKPAMWIRASPHSVGAFLNLSHKLTSPLPFYPSRPSVLFILRRRIWEGVFVCGVGGGGWRIYGDTVGPGGTHSIKLGTILETKTG